MRNNSYVSPYAISSSIYYIREFNTGAEPFMAAMIIIIIIISAMGSILKFLKSKPLTSYNMKIL